MYGERCVSRRVGQVFLENAVKGMDITVTGDGSDSLDFTYIDDLVEGVRRIIENDNAKNEVFNITFGKGRTINSMAEIVKENFRK